MSEVLVAVLLVPAGMGSEQVVVVVFVALPWAFVAAMPLVALLLADKPGVVEQVVVLWPVSLVRLPVLSCQHGYIEMRGPSVCVFKAAAWLLSGCVYGGRVGVLPELQWSIVVSVPQGSCPCELDSRDGILIRRTLRCAAEFCGFCRGGL